MGREYRMLALFVVVVTVILAVLIDWDVTDTVGSRPGDARHGDILSRWRRRFGPGGFIGMSIAVRANTGRPSRLWWGSTQHCGWRSTAAR